jgi:predicted alpha/beta superfamily hydrolase
MENTYPSVTIRDTHARQLHSEIVGEDYQILIHLPQGYVKSEDYYPVLYLPDGDQFFGMVTDIVNLLNHRDGIPEMIIVGIAYGTEVNEHFNQRIRDLSPSKVKDFPSSGGGEHFLGFIRDELIPFVESEYRVDRRKRTYLGASIGGLFGLYVLFSQPELFMNYIISSPSIFWDNGVIYQIEREYADEHKELKVKVFLSVGSLENPDTDVHPIQEFEEVLTCRKYVGLELTTTVIDGETHFSVQPAAYVKGIKALF